MDIGSIERDGTCGVMPWHLMFWLAIMVAFSLRTFDAASRALPMV